MGLLQSDVLIVYFVSPFTSGQFVKLNSLRDQSLSKLYIFNGKNVMSRVA